LVFPGTLALINTTFAEGRDRNRALGVWGGCGAAGLVVGVLLGGVLTRFLGWESVFFVNVPLAGVALLGAFVLIEADQARDAERRFDLPGALSATGGITLLVFALVQGPDVMVKDAKVVTAVQSISENEASSRDDIVLVQALLVNRGQAKVQLASGTRLGAWPVMAEFQRSRERMSQSRADRANGKTLVAPLADRLENDQIDGFSGLAVSGELPDELLTRALTDRLWRMRVRITLSIGDVIFSHWFPTPTPWDRAPAKSITQVRAGTASS
jgi:hypothetical protein